MRKRASVSIGAALLSLGVVTSLAAGAWAAPGRAPRQLGHIPASSTSKPVARHGQANTGPFGAAPTIGASWQGIVDGIFTPPDPNGAIGPNSYVEIVNSKIAIYNRSGGLIDTDFLSILTGHGRFNVSDPMVLWDPGSQRFYYNVWDVSNGQMAWGFSKDNNPTSIPDSFCNYTSSFGYTGSELPDYPKLGQTRNFLLIGVNHYPNFSAQHADRTDLLWIRKYDNRNPVTTCPALSSFTSGSFQDLRMGDGTVAFTLVPAIQTDQDPVGYIMAETQIETPCPCPIGTDLTVFTLKPNKNNPKKPVLSPAHDIPVADFSAPLANAPQKGTTGTVAVLDGRLEHAVSAFDPQFGKVAVWTAHSVDGGAGSEGRWYEIDPNGTSPVILQQGTLSDASLWIFNLAISPDRTCNMTGCAHGDAMVGGFTTSSTTTFPSDQMVSKIGANPVSAFVMVHASSVATTSSRWGDYGGATPDPAASLGALHGEVWLTQEWTTGGDQTWNWEALP